MTKKGLNHHVAQHPDPTYEVVLHNVRQEAKEKRKEASHQLAAELKKLREENVKLCKECIVLRHGEQVKEADDGQKERNEKI